MKEPKVYIFCQKFMLTSIREQNEIQAYSLSSLKNSYTLHVFQMLTLANMTLNILHINIFCANTFIRKY